MDQLLLKGKNVLITGAGRNIGRSIAEEMAKEGANICFTEIDKERCRDLEKTLTQYQVASRGVIADITSPRDSDKLCNTLANDRMPIDVLVNNVGTHLETKQLERSLVRRVADRIEPGGKAGASQRLWKEVYETNVFGPLYLTDSISEAMIQGGIQGCIIFVTSIHQWVIKRDAAYSSSKAALGMLIKELAVALAPARIRVNGIAPGFVEEDERGEAISQRHTPLHGTSIPPCYIGRAAVYLASDYFSKCTTGTVLKIDSGLSLYNHMVDIVPAE